MQILMNGVKVREEEVDTLEIQFAQLNEAGQKRFFKENKDLFFSEALFSEYESVRKLAILLRNDCSSDTINMAIQRLRSVKSIYELPNHTAILILLKTDNFTLSKTNRVRLAMSTSKEIRQWIAQHNHQNGIKKSS